MLEEITDQPASGRVDDYRIRLGQSLQTGGEIRCLTDTGLLLCQACTDHIADDHQACGNTNSTLELDGFHVEAIDGVDGAESRPHSPFGVVLMRLRVAEIGQNAVACGLRYEAVELRDHVSYGAMIRGDDFSQIFGVETRRKRCRTDQVAEDYRQLPAFGI